MTRPARILRHAALVLLAITFVSGCRSQNTTDDQAQAATGDHAEERSLASGTRLLVALGTRLSSETAHTGDEWHGTLTEAVPTQNGGMIAAGSAVDGVVSAVKPAERGSRAMLDLSVRHVHVDGRAESVRAGTEPVIAGSTRARNLGAIAGGAVAGALIGKVVGDGHNAAAGGILGGAAAAGVVANSKGYQVVLPDGIVLDFTVSQTVAMR